MNLLIPKLLSLRYVEYLIIDNNLKILEMSPGAYRLADVPDEVKQDNDIRLSFPELFGVEDVIDTILQGKENNFELKGIIRTESVSSPLYIDICITKNVQDKNSNSLIVIIADVTERMILEKSLIQSANEANLLLRNLKAAKQYTDEIMKSMADALLVTTLSGKIKKINPSAQVLLEYEEAELIGQDISIIIRELEDLKLGKGEKENIYNPPIKELETVCITKSGKKIHVAFSCSIVQTEIENFQGYVYTLRDMSDRKQAELAKQEFLAMISHEIRTPITSVNGMASLLLNTELTAQQQDFAQTIYMSSNALHKIINDILDFSKIESGKLELEEQSFELRRCINEALYLVSPIAKEKKLILMFLDTPDIPTTVVGDITRLRQILINLLSNAIKFTETGSIEVSAIAREIMSNQHGKNSYEIHFVVKDTGIGIPSDRLERLFKAFSQVNSSITRQYGGTGLGLAICKQLTELMGGRIWVDSEPGVGSAFNFTITTPVISEGLGHGDWKINDLAADAKINPRMAEQYPLKILLVEDHVINQRIIRLMLQQMGYQPDVANNGLEALLALRRQLYDVVLMDLQMPVMDGITATQHICQEWTPDVRPMIIALTANAMSGDRDRYLASGMDDYLVKPIRIAELMQLLKRCQIQSQKSQKAEQASAQNIQESKEQVSTNLSPSDSCLPTANSFPIDQAILQKILQMADLNSSAHAVEFLLEIIDDYLKDAPILLQNIHLYFSQTNLKSLRRAAHTLSSISAILGATTLASLCAELETMVVTEALFGATEKIFQIEAEYQQVQIVLEQERQKYKD
ncbi:ATP-binding protein [Nostoc sp. UHCC 0302]|uniref:PAS domain-containing hybrid sensor histidine kinase/response regulator n=1 Tax=Nostoc sp. UHCC 0302 TaxID=3134896 RepID=UPI00311C9254